MEGWSRVHPNLVRGFRPRIRQEADFFFFKANAEDVQGGGMEGWSRVHPTLVRGFRPRIRQEALFFFSRPTQRMYKAEGWKGGQEYIQVWSGVSDHGSDKKQTFFLFFQGQRRGRMYKAEGWKGSLGAKSSVIVAKSNDRAA